MDFICKRSNDVSTKIMCSNDDYMALFSKDCEIFERFKRALPDEMQGLLMEMEAIETNMEVIMNDGVYKQGLIDGFNIARIIEQLGRETSCK
jgi:hypothetical protein